jgi:hypothetical protein
MGPQEGLSASGRATPQAPPTFSDSFLTEFSEVRGLLGALTCIVPWCTYICLTQGYAAFVTWLSEAA